MHSKASSRLSLTHLPVQPSSRVKSYYECSVHTKQLASADLSPTTLAMRYRVSLTFHVRKHSNCKSTETTSQQPRRHITRAENTVFISRIRHQLWDYDRTDLIYIYTSLFTKMVVKQRKRKKKYTYIQKYNKQKRKQK